MTQLFIHQIGTLESKAPRAWLYSEVRLFSPHSGSTLESQHYGISMAAGEGGPGASVNWGMRRGF